MELQTRTTCQLGSVDDEWHTEDIEGGDELEAAIEECNEDHDLERVLDVGDTLWLFKVEWNDKTDSVWVRRFAYNGGMEAMATTEE